MKLKFLLALWGTFLMFSSAYAAVTVDTSRIPAQDLKNYFTRENPIQMDFISEHIDFKGTNHARFQETYKGHAVWAADLIVHVPKEAQNSVGKFDPRDLNNKSTFMNGFIYTHLNKDLPGEPANIANIQLDKAFAKVEKIYGKAVADQRSELIVYVDKKNKAHWALKISYTTQERQGIPSKPIAILDALTLEVYEVWDNLQTESDVLGGGYGGNPKMGQIIYDGGPNHYAALNIMRNDSYRTCYMKSPLLVVLSLKTNTYTQFACSQTDPNHNSTYWNNSLDEANGGYNPSNDVFFNLTMVNNLYRSWYGIPILTKNGQPMLVKAWVHKRMENAYWDGQQMVFGDGITTFYPLTCLDVSAHEISHGFTQQHSNLYYKSQSGGLNESYSDMAGEASKYYVRGSNNWWVGSDIMKSCSSPDCALRYMDNPPRDGHSIDNVKNYREGLDVHYSSGVFNKAFYLMSGGFDWNVRKAFDVMVKANMDYWTSNSTFYTAACGVMRATKDYGYDLQTVISAMNQVGIDTTQCGV